MLATLDKENEKFSDKAYGMLIVWKQREGKGATYKVLQEAQRHRLVRLASLEEEFCKWQYLVAVLKRLVHTLQILSLCNPKVK